MPRAWVINEYSGYQGLELTELDQEQPGQGEVRLRVEAFALNWGDMDLMRDNYSFSFPSFPAKIGMEAAGIVDAIGPGVSGIEVGERYCTLPHFYYNGGASTESLVINASYVTKAPDGLSAVESASIWMQYMTAYYPIVELAQAGPGKTILVTAATGTAGAAALEIGRVSGATMIGTTRFDYNREYLQSLGADHVFVQGQGVLADEIQRITDGKGVNAVFDSIGGGMINQYSPAFARDACVYFYGMLDSKFPELPIVEMFQTNTTFHPYSLFHYVQDAEQCAKGVAYVNEALQAKSIAPSIDKVFPMEGYRDAWDYVSAPRKAHGKVVVETGL